MIASSTYLATVAEIVCVTVSVRVTDDWTVDVLTIVDLGLEHVVNLSPAFATCMSAFATRLSASTYR